MSYSSKKSNLPSAEKVGNEYWLLIPGKPSSAQARKRGAKIRLTKYKKTIRSTASRIIKKRLKGRVRISLYYFHKGTDIDIDNFQKPILDSLIGIAYDDDNQVDGLHTDRYNLNTSVTIPNVTCSLIPKALSRNKECVIICVKPIS